MAGDGCVIGPVSGHPVRCRHHVTRRTGEPVRRTHSEDARAASWGGAPNTLADQSPPPKWHRSPGRVPRIGPAGKPARRPRNCGEQSSPVQHTRLVRPPPKPFSGPPRGADQTRFRNRIDPAPCAVEVIMRSASAQVKGICSIHRVVPVTFSLRTVSASSSTSPCTGCARENWTQRIRWAEISRWLTSTSSPPRTA